MSEIDRKNLTILVVEDNEDTRYFMRLGLEELGYRVCEAEDGEQAIDVACREQPDAILMDIGMPVLNGLTATARIREHDEFRTIPIVAVTAHQEVELRDGAQACGFTAYVTKPIDFKWLDELLKNLIG
jgi:two-component system, sensor histidine kinase and response regulator